MPRLSTFYKCMRQWTWARAEGRISEDKQLSHLGGGNSLASAITDASQDNTCGTEVSTQREEQNHCPSDA